MTEKTTCDVCNGERWLTSANGRDVVPCPKCGDRPPARPEPLTYKRFRERGNR